MGRSKGYIAPHALDAATPGKAKTITVALPTALLEALDAFAVTDGSSRSEVVRAAIQAWLDRMTPSI